jgi:arylsulfatase A-like enzyme
MSVTRRNFLTGACASALAAQPRAAAASRPNILLILADDLAAWMLGCYGNKEIRTPNIDRLAAAGTRFTNSFVCTPICSASRATLFTGRTPMQHGIHDFLTASPVAEPAQGQAAPPASFASEVMISDLLAQEGYRCGYVGKWHMGNDEKPGHGFSYTYTMSGGSRSYNDPEMSLNGSKVKESGYLTDLMTKRALEFIDQQQAGSPWFLTVGYLNPHTPYEGHPQKYYDMYKGVTFDSFGILPKAANALREASMMDDPVANLRKCAAATTALDDQIPLLQRKLIDKGFFDNTLVIFTGDNGFLLGRHGLWSKGHASNPINMYEESIGVPMIWSWPGRVPTSIVRPELISFYDFVPTICDALRISIPARNLCGRTYLHLATGRKLVKEERWQDLVFGNFRYTDYARDNRYKVVLRHDGEGPNELYDMRKDPREMVNQYDNPQYITVRDRLVTALRAWKQKYSS